MKIIELIILLVQVTLDCKDEDGNSITMQKKVQIITNCSCSSCTETSRIKPDYNTLLQTFAEENIDKNVNQVHERADLLSNPNLNVSKNTTKDGLHANERFLQLFKHLKDKNIDEVGAKELFTKYEEDIDLEHLRQLLSKYSQEEEHQKHHQAHHKVEKIIKESQEETEEHETHHPGLHMGPHHSMVLDSDVKEKIDVEPHYLHPAVAGQEISYHDNVLVDKSKKKDF